MSRDNSTEDFVVPLSSDVELLTVVLSDAAGTFSGVMEAVSMLRSLVIVVKLTIFIVPVEVDTFVVVLFQLVAPDASCTVVVLITTSLTTAGVVVDKSTISVPFIGVDDVEFSVSPVDTADVLAPSDICVDPSIIVWFIVISVVLGDVTEVVSTSVVSTGHQLMTRASNGSSGIVSVTSVIFKIKTVLSSILPKEV
jgi:hypothetical protein